VARGRRQEKILLGTRKGLIVYAGGASDWHWQGDHFLGIPVSLAAVDPRSGTWWALLDHGHWGCKLHRSADEGENWEEIEAPKYPDGEWIKEGAPATLKYLWAFTAGGSAQAGRIYLGTESGGLFVSDDNGDSFRLNRGLWDQPGRMERWFGGGRDNPGIHSIVVDPADPDHLYVGISVAGVFESTDAGASWTPRNKGLRADYLPDPNVEVGFDTHLLVACPARPDRMWQQNHCGIYRSDDAGASWNDVSQDEGSIRFGFAIAVDELDGDVAWVVPAVKDEYRIAVNYGLKVCRTEDGGRSWRSFGKGLPGAACYDLVYRHALDVRGDTLVFGSTTGNAFISEDRGESWRCLGNHLPPIYSCRFA